MRPDLAPLLLLPAIEVGAQDLAGLELIARVGPALVSCARRRGLARAAPPLGGGGEGEGRNEEGDQKIGTHTHGTSPYASGRNPPNDTRWRAPRNTEADRDRILPCASSSSSSFFPLRPAARSSWRDRTASRPRPSARPGNASTRRRAAARRCP